MAHTVLVLAYYYPPMGLSGVQRVAKFTKYLPQYGWNPIVVTTGPTLYYAEDQTLLHEVEAAGVEIVRTEPSLRVKKLLEKGVITMPRESVRKFISKSSSALFVPDNKKKWAAKAVALAKDVVARHPVDVIFASGPPFSTVMAAAQLSAETGIPYVADYRDLWYGNQFHSYPTLWHKHRHQKFEHQTLARASRITVTNRRMKEFLIANYEFLDFHDVVILPHGWDPDDFAQPMSAETRGRLFPNGSTDAFRLTFTGTFYDSVTPVPFFKAIKKLRKEHPEVNLELHFAGMLRKEYQAKAHRMKLDDIIVNHGYLPHAESVALIQQSDALWMMLGDARNVDTCAPAKLYEYFGTQKPILASTPKGAARNDAMAYGASYITDPYDVPAIVQAVLSMYNDWRTGRHMTPNRDFVLQHQRTVLTESLVKVLQKALRVV